MGGAIYKDSPAIKYEERNIYLNSIQSLGRYSIIKLVLSYDRNP